MVILFSQELSLLFSHFGRIGSSFLQNTEAGVSPASRGLPCTFYASVWEVI